MLMESCLAWRKPPSPGRCTYRRPTFLNDLGSEVLLNCGLWKERGTVRTSTTRVTPCAPKQADKLVERMRGMTDREHDRQRHYVGFQLARDFGSVHFTGDASRRLTSQKISHREPGKAF